VFHDLIRGRISLLRKFGSREEQKNNIVEYLANAISVVKKSNFMYRNELTNIYRYYLEILNEDIEASLGSAMTTIIAPKEEGGAQEIDATYDDNFYDYDYQYDDTDMKE
jgi:hypothetical protein